MTSIANDDTTLSFVHTGSGTPVLCLHSSAGSSVQWKRLAAELERGYHVLAPDLHGHGGTSPWSRSRSMRLSDEVALLTPLVSGLPAPIHLVGHSYGGAVALKLALTMPERIRTLTLFEPVLFAFLGRLGAHAAYAEVSQVAEACVSAVQAGRPAEAARAFVDYWNGAGSWAGLPDRQRVIIERSMPSVARHWDAVLGETMSLDDCARLRIPTLLLAGDRGPSPVRRVVDLLAGALPNAIHGVIAGAGHMAPVTHADAVNAAITAHLGRHPVGAAVAA
jgi:Predicted hydrolases or acyltransferases (alpha/beta hydrolase superfamily)